MILYFTGTGNSAYTAKKIAQVTDEPLLSMNDRIKQEDYIKIDGGTKLVFVVPTYAWRIPRIVEAWIKRTPFKGTPAAYFVMTCGGQIGDAGKYLQKLCVEKGFDYMGVAAVKMPENYIALYTAPDQAEAKHIIADAESAILAAAESIRGGHRLPESPAALADRLRSGPINTIFYPLYVHADKFWATESCVGCGKCEQICPLNNIQLKDGRPVWGKNCTHCMACICKCPVQAIEYGKNSSGKLRYQCPY